MKKGIIYTSITWITLILIDLILIRNEIHSKYLVVENIMQILFIFVWIIPILLIFLIKKKVVKYSLLTIGVIIIIINSFYIIFLGLFFINDLFVGNGYRQIFEKKISNNTYFSIYRSPDEGAFGGDSRTYTIDRKYFLGFVKRHSLKPEEYEIHQDIKDKTETIIIEKDTIFVDNKLLKGKGDLK